MNKLFYREKPTRQLKPPTFRPSSRKPKRLINQNSTDFSFVTGLFLGNGFFVSTGKRQSSPKQTVFCIEEDTKNSALPHFERVGVNLGQDKRGYSLNSVDFAFALHDATMNRTKIPQIAFDNPKNALLLSKGMFHANAGVHSKKGFPRIQLEMRTPAVAEQLCVLLFKHFGILPTIGTDCRISVAHPQDIETVLRNGFLTPNKSKAIKQMLAQVPKRIQNRSTEVSQYENAKRLSLESESPRCHAEIGARLGIDRNVVRRWQTTVPQRVKSYAKIIDMAKTQNIPLKIEFPLAYQYGTLANLEKAKKADIL